MKVETVMNILQVIKGDYPTLTNMEILKILEVKTLMEANARGR